MQFHIVPGANFHKIKTWYNMFHYPHSICSIFKPLGTREFHDNHHCWTEKHSLSLDARGLQGILWSKRKNISYNVNFSSHLQHYCKEAKGEGQYQQARNEADGKFPHFAACYNFAQQMAETNGVRWRHRSHLVGAAFPIHLTGVYWIKYGDGTGHRPLVILTKSHWSLVWTSADGIVP